MIIRSRYLSHLFHLLLAQTVLLLVALPAMAQPRCEQILAASIIESAASNAVLQLTPQPMTRAQKLRVLSGGARGRRIHIGPNAAVTDITTRAELDALIDLITSSNSAGFISKLKDFDASLMTVRLKTPATPGRTEIFDLEVRGNFDMTLTLYLGQSLTIRLSSGNNDHSRHRIEEEFLHIPFAQEEPILAVKGLRDLYNFDMAKFSTDADTSLVNQTVISAQMAQLASKIMDLLGLEFNPFAEKSNFYDSIPGAASPAMIKTAEKAISALQKLATNDYVYVEKTLVLYDQATGLNLEHNGWMPRSQYEQLVSNGAELQQTQASLVMNHMDVVYQGVLVPKILIEAIEAAEKL